MELISAIFGTFFGVILVLMCQKYLPILLSKFIRPKKKFRVTLDVSYFLHATNQTKKGELVKMKPISLDIMSLNDIEAYEIAIEIVKEHLKVELVEVEEIPITFD